MKKALLGVLVIGLLLAAEEKKPDDAGAKLKGTWTIVSMIEGGQDKSAELKGATMTFDGDKVAFKKKNDTKMGTFKLDATQNPPHLDIMPEGKDQTMKMVYKLDGDTLTLVGPKQENGERPKSLEAKEGVVITLKREKK